MSTPRHSDVTGPAGGRARPAGAKLRTHTCPATPCPKIVPNNLLACPTHWFKLTADTRQGITRTAGLNLLHPDRRAALAAARAEWAAMRPQQEGTAHE
jgi:hypothetical protein